MMKGFCKIVGFCNGFTLKKGSHLREKNNFDAENSRYDQDRYHYWRKATDH